MTIFSQILFVVSLCLSLVFPTTSYAQDPINQVAIADKKITLPKLNGIVQVDVPPLLDMAKNMTYRANRLLGMYIDEEQYKALVSGNAIDLRRYALVQTLRSMEQDELTADGFMQIRTKMKEQYSKSIKINQTLLDQETKRISQKIGEQMDDKTLEMKVGEIRVDQIIELKNAIVVLAKTVVQVQSEGKIQHIPMQIGMGTGRANGKLVYFYSYSRFESEDDQIWVRSLNEQWFAGLEAVNK
ncbi:MAG: hypothetical protein E6Q34_10020 [Burkholderiaceae bacterium]|nr:MAG: hypothetical protein E6Q34_10020 [Burkholderiaceae bacterium]